MHTWEDNIKMCFEKIDCEDEKWIHLLFSSGRLFVSKIWSFEYRHRKMGSVPHRQKRRANR
jgi:hypothetical protein